MNGPKFRLAIEKMDRQVKAELQLEAGRQTYAVRTTATAAGKPVDDALT